MDIELDKKGDSLRIIIDGNIDSDAGRKLAVSLQEAMGMDGVVTAILDLTTVRAISSTGIGKLMNFSKFMAEKKGSMSVKGISDQLYALFMEMRLDRVFPIEK
jgi:anti-anti-sigma factor